MQHFSQKEKGTLSNDKPVLSKNESKTKNYFVVSFGQYLYLQRLTPLLLLLAAPGLTEGKPELVELIIEL